MPTYLYHCSPCDEEFDKILSISKYDEPQNCPNCGEGPARKMVTRPNFILKGDDWAGKNIRINNQMRKKNERLSSRQADRKKERGISLVPNVEGERTESWSDAAKLAKSKGKSATGYSERAKTEKK